MPSSGRAPAGVATLLASLSLVVSVQGAAVAGDAKAGRQKIDKCIACHGEDGLAKIAEAPNLAGQNEQYLLEQLTAFKQGARTNELMSVVVKDLSDADIEDLAAYFSSIPITVGKPPGG